ncbi:MAG: putative toxin-antitoxin system toxin component, PIN family [Rhodocyclaceae bacterium]|nr:putative toxin-antitoxin system toxin component, PIN family [Rhodocyclaceae bacterium]
MVLDTNVLLSLWVFRDSRFSSFRSALDTGRWRVLTSPACHGEFRRVLRYPLFSLDEGRQQDILSEFLSLAEFVTGAAPTPAPLPLCRDPDDQKFLELARDGRADWLVTSDKALLRVSRRRRLEGRFRILRPEDALEELGPG